MSVSVFPFFEKARMIHAIMQNSDNMDRGSVNSVENYMATSRKGAEIAQ